jgi:hypothetical protein
MRWIFYSLVVANLAAFIWHLNISRFPGASSIQSYYMDENLAEGEILVLISERVPSGSLSSEPVDQKGEVNSVELEPLDELHKQINSSQSSIDRERDALGATCYELGPLGSESNSIQVANFLSSIGLVTLRYERQVIADKEHWVLIPSRASRQEALRVLRELKAKQVDSYLVGEGEDRNAISLGLFVKEASAISVAERVSSYGYETEVRSKEKLFIEHWVVISGARERVQLTEIKRELPESDRDINILDSSCEMFAQGN